MECEKLENRRDRTFLRGLGGEDSEDTVGKALFETEGEDLERVKRMLQDLWFTRKVMIEKMIKKNKVGDMRQEAGGGGNTERPDPHNIITIFGSDHNRR